MNKIKAEFNKYVYTVFVFFNYLYLFFINHSLVLKKHLLLLSSMLKTAVLLDIFCGNNDTFDELFNTFKKWFWKK